MEPTGPRPLPREVRSGGMRGRGASGNPGNRFEATWHEPDAEQGEAEEPLPTTVFVPDHARSVISRNDSPDVGFAAGLNPYRGCEHGCAYCYARPTHEYLGLSAGLDFESRILVKEQAPELLRAELASPGWKPQVLGMSGVTDCYQPVERRLRLTRRCLEVLAEFRNPVSIITKNRLVARDADVLAELARHRAVCVTLSITTLDPLLAGRLEPRASAPSARLAAIRMLADAGVPVGVNVAPVIPGLNDHEMPAILQAAADHGAGHAGYQIVRLPLAVAPLFARWLEEHAPTHAAKVLHRIEAMRGGRMNAAPSAQRMSGEGVWADQLGALFAVARRRAGIGDGWPETSTAAFRRPGEGVQQTIFG